MNIIPRRQSFDRQKLVLSFCRLKNKPKNPKTRPHGETLLHFSCTYIYDCWMMLQHRLETIAAANKNISQRQTGGKMCVNKSKRLVGCLLCRWNFCGQIGRPPTVGLFRCAFHHLCGYADFRHTCRASPSVL